MSTQKAKYKPPVESRARIGERAKILMMAILIQVEEAFKAAQSRLSEEHFRDPLDRPFGLIWAAAQDYYQLHKKLPGCEEHLLIALEPRTLEDGQLTEADTDFIDQAVALMYNVHERSLQLDTGMRLLGAFIEEKLAARLAAELGRGELPQDLPAILQQRRDEVMEALALDMEDLQEPFSGTLAAEKGVEKRPSQLAFIDDLLNGGPGLGEVIGVSGPINSCKTTLSVLLAAKSCLRDYNGWIRAGKPEQDPPTTYLVAWEEPSQNVRLRAMSAGAWIHKDTLELGDYEKNFSRRGKLKPYERDRYASMSPGIPQDGEYERWRAYARVYNKTLRIINFNGEDPRLMPFASDLVQGVRAVIERDQRRRNHPGVGLIILDYAGAAAKQHVASGKGREDYKRTYVAGFPFAAKTLLASAYRCPVWVFHQIAAASNKKHSGLVPDITETMDAKNFYENCDFGFNIGVPTKERVALFGMVKGRRTGRPDNVIIRIDGVFNNIYKADGYGVRNRQIVPQADLARVAEPIPGDVSLEQPDFSSAFGDRDIGV